MVSEAVAYRPVRRFKAVDKQSDLRLLGQVRQEFFAVVGNTGRLRIQRAEVSESHRK